MRLLEGLDQRVSVLYGEVPPEIRVKENGVTFAYDLPKGQKTGSFLDQRENHWRGAPLCVRRRARLLQLSGRIRAHVADRCEHVEGIEMAPAAIEAARRNQQLNGISNVTSAKATPSIC